MFDRRPLPTGVFVTLGAVVLGLGGAWWATAAPEKGEHADAGGVRVARPWEASQVGGGTTVHLDLGTGRILQYSIGRPGILDGAAESEQEAFQRMVTEMKKRGRNR